VLQYKEIFLGSQCNNKCLYCPVCHKDLPQPDLNSLLDSLKKREGDNVALYGGEPTLSKDLFAIIDAAKKNGCRRIKLITNGRAFSDAQFLYRVIAAGCRLFEIKLWGSHPPLHDHLTGTAGSFQETVRGLENLAGFPEDKFVCIRIPICRGNYTDLGNIVAAALSFGVNRIILSVDDHALTFQSVLPHLHNAINISIFNRIWILTEGMPFCLMAGLEHHIGEMYQGLTTIYERTFQKHRYCTECIYRELCSGVDAAYLKQFGEADFSPVTINRHFQDMKAFYE
jgi:sulfatase maturation enzyme AslB (radical SAM superfamily)